MLKINALGFGYSDTPVLENISFQVEPGVLCGLFGPNGSGKTTLFKCCLRFFNSYRGTITINNRDIQTINTREMARLVAYVPQNHKAPFPYLVKEMVLMGRTPHLNRSYIPGKQDKRKAARALERLEISHLADHPYNRLSGGQRQMVLIARAIAQESEMIFLDEPTSALDFKNQLAIWKTMRQIADSGTAILACSHDPNHVAWFCDKTVVLNKSAIAAEGDPEQAISQEVLDLVYKDVCCIRRVDNTRMVLPKEVTEREKRYAHAPEYQCRSA